MKWVVAFLLLPFFCDAQGVKLNQYDKFVKKHRVELEPVALLSSPAATLNVTFLAVAQDLFLQVSGWGWGATTVDDGNELRFLLPNDSSIILKADGLQTFEPGLERNTYRHRYRIGAEEVEALARLELSGIRKFSFKESSDIKIPSELRARLQKPAALFLSELRKGIQSKTLRQIGGNDVLRFIGDSVRFCSLVYNTRYSQTVEGKLTVLELQSDFSQPIVHAIIAEEDRSRFGTAPEKEFLNKEVCLSGVLTMRNNTPTVVLRSAGQLTVGGKSNTSTGYKKDVSTDGFRTCANTAPMIAKSNLPLKQCNESD